MNTITRPIVLTQQDKWYQAGQQVPMLVQSAAPEQIPTPVVQFIPHASELVRIELAELLCLPLDRCKILESVSERVHLVEFLPQMARDPIMPVVLDVQSYLPEVGRYHQWYRVGYHTWADPYAELEALLENYRVVRNPGRWWREVKTHVETLVGLLPGLGLSLPERQYVRHNLTILLADPMRTELLRAMGVK